MANDKKQASMFDGFQDSPLGSNSPLPESAEEFSPKETGAKQSRIDLPETATAPSWSELAQAKMEGNTDTKRCVKCNRIRPSDHFMNWGDGPICGDNCNGPESSDSLDNSQLGAQLGLA